MAAKDVCCTSLIVEYDGKEMVAMMDDKSHRNYGACSVLRDEVATPYAVYLSIA
jgi:hypothetical protein